MFKNVLIACEYSGITRNAFAALGHNAWSCDILPTESPGQHYQGDVRDILNNGWDLMIAHPPCTYLSAAGLHYCRGNPLRVVERERAMQFVISLFHAPIGRIAIENPPGYLSTQWKKPTQIMRMNDFGEDACKPTCYWLKGLPPLLPTKKIKFTRATFRQSKWYSKNRSSKDRSKTFYGIAEAMALQWGGRV